MMKCFLRTKESIMKILFIFFWLIIIHCSIFAQADTIKKLPIIDMHMHAFPLEYNGYADLPNPVTGKLSGATSDEELIRITLTEMLHYNIVKAIMSGPLDFLFHWKAEEPNIIIGGIHFDEVTSMPDIEQLRKLYIEGRIGAFGELAIQYVGLSLSDSLLEPYLALAEELDIPVGIHTGVGPAETPYHCCPKFRVTYGNPVLIEEALVKHPNLRIYLMHGGWPYLEETKAIMSVYPQVYADLATINWIIPREEFHEYMHSLIRAGFGERLMFGSDQMVWPEVIGMAIEGIESSDFLSEKQKRDIFFNNAIRFLRLDEKEFLK